MRAISAGCLTSRSSSTSPPQGTSSQVSRQQLAQPRVLLDRHGALFEAKAAAVGGQLGEACAAARAPPPPPPPRLPRGAQLPGGRLQEVDREDAPLEQRGHLGGGLGFVAEVGEEKVAQPQPLPGLTFPSAPGAPSTPVAITRGRWCR